MQVLYKICLILWYISLKLVKYTDMDKIFIRDIPSFCTSKQEIIGQALLKTDDFISFFESDLRMFSQDIKLTYAFEGFSEYEDYFHLKGFWSADIQLKCTYCRETIQIPVTRHYEKLRLVSDEDNSLNYNEDCQECRFDFFDLRPWLFSELMMEIPISPKHSACALPFECVHMANL